MISIIIPTLNEALKISSTISHLMNKRDAANINEIIIADGGSADNTIEIAKSTKAKTIVIAGMNRAAQMNAGAAIASGKIFFFLHADSVPEAGFSEKIIDAFNNKFDSGCFRLAFDHDHWFLKANAWFTRFNINGVRFGDQGLFVTKEVFEKCGGFNEGLFIMEDQEIIHRLKRFSSFKVINSTIVTSARKYLVNGIYKTQVTFYLIWLLYYLGISQKHLLILYRKLSRQNPRN
jgi:rSAM/selenodomain-associated transferase 2